MDTFFRPASIAVVGASARKSVELILAIYESARTGREVKLDEFVEAARK